MLGESVILKTDRLGRVRTPSAQREALLDAFERSGLSGMKFAALHGVKYPSFANWVQQRKRHRLMDGAGAGVGSEDVIDRTMAPSGSAAQWWEAVVDNGAARKDETGCAGPGIGLHLLLPGGVRMEITAADQVGWAAHLLQLLAPLAPGARPGAQNLQPLRSC